MAKISVVVPSLNQGRFLGECLESILAQDDPEVLLFDAGSTDTTHTVIRRYAEQLAFWRSHPDAGQPPAINEGFGRGTGRILGWLNSDDLYLPGALRQVEDALAPHLEEPVVCYGGCEVFRENSVWKEIRPALAFDLHLLQTTDFLDQPSVFWTRKAWELVGPLDESLHYAFDWDWFLRAAKCCRFIRLDATLSRYRVHAAHKSGTGGQVCWQELLEVVRRHSSAEVVRHYEFLSHHRLRRWWLNKRMRVFQTLRARVPSAAGALAHLLSPPYWFLPHGIERKLLWQISGIR